MSGGGGAGNWAGVEECHIVFSLLFPSLWAVSDDSDTANNHLPPSLHRYNEEGS